MTIIVAIDTETTGLGLTGEPPRLDGVVEIGLAWRNRDGFITHWGMTCNPGAELLADGRAEGALRVNNIPLAEILAAPPVVEVAWVVYRLLQQIHGDLCTAAEEPVEMVAFNADFDRRFLADRMWAGANLDLLTWHCAMKKTMEWMRVHRRVHLKDAALRLGLAPLAGLTAHRAAADAVTALRVWYALAERGVPVSGVQIQTA